MYYYKERLQRELIQILDFWKENVISQNWNGFNPECTIRGSANNDSALGSLFLGRVIFGASAACRYLKTNEYRKFADLAFKGLYEQFKNPKGGFYWALSHDNKVIHNPEHINETHAAILIGLAEYASLTQSPVILWELKKLYAFLHEQRSDRTNGGFLVGHSTDWSNRNLTERNIGTHIRHVEAYTNYYKLIGDKSVLKPLELLVRHICKKFISQGSLGVFSLSGDTLKIANSDICIGHISEICSALPAATVILKDDELHQECCSLSQKLLGFLYENAFDKQYGGLFDLLSDNGPSSSTKSWWTQTETAIASLDAYSFSKDKRFLSYAVRLIEYIENTFSDPKHGEWYFAVQANGKPIESYPKTGLWKSLYYNVRYLIGANERIEYLIAK